MGVVRGAGSLWRTLARALGLSVAVAIGMVLLLALALLVINRHDQPLRPEVAQFMAVSEVPDGADEDLFLGLIGLHFGASAAELSEVGRQRLEEYRNGFPSYSPPKTGLASGIGCGSAWLGARASCLAYVSAHRDELLGLLRQHRKLLDSYLALRQFDSYSYRLGTDLSAPIAPWASVLDAKRLHHAEIALIARDEPATATAALLADIEFWRRVLALDSLTLIDKNIAISSILADLWLVRGLTAAGLWDESSVNGSGLASRPMTAAERPLDSVLAYELQFLASATDELMLLEDWETPEPSWYTQAVGPILQRYFLALYQPNDSLNRAQRFYEALSGITKGPCRYLEAEVARTSREYWGLDWSDAYNPTGQMLLSIGQSALVRYPLRLCDLEGFLAITDLQREILRGGLQPSDVAALLEAEEFRFRDPYRAQSLSWDPEARTVTLSVSDSRLESFMPWSMQFQ